MPAARSTTSRDAARPLAKAVRTSESTGAASIGAPQG